MRIAIVHPYLFRYARGIERFTWELSSSLARKGVAVDLLTWRWPRPLSWGEIPAGVRVREVPYFRYYMAWAAIPYYLRWLAGARYDWLILHFAGYGEGHTLRLLQRFRSLRYCIVFHFPRELVPHRYAEFQRFGLAHRAQQLVGVSDYVARGVTAEFARECAVVGNGVNPAVFHPDPDSRESTRRRLRIGPDAPVLITLAALEERKGVQWVVRAIPELLGEFPSLAYLVLGEGPHRSALQAEVHKLGLEGHVFLLGVAEDVVAFLAAADIGCLLAYGESFGICLIEYMAMELPVLASRHPPFEELIRPAWGAMVDETDTGAVAAKLGAWLRDPGSRAALGAAGRHQVLQHHTWECVGDRYLELLSSDSPVAAAGNGR